MSDPTGYAPAGPIKDSPASPYAGPERRREAFAAALDGVTIGSYDGRIIAWLCNLDDSTCRTVVSLLWRVRDAGHHEAAQLASVRAVLDAFDWEHDDRQYALEHIDDILNGRPR